VGGFPTFEWGGGNRPYNGLFDCGLFAEFFDNGLFKNTPEKFDDTCRDRYSTSEAGEGARTR